MPKDQIKRGRKFDQVLKGARDVFMREGFEGATVDDIAQMAQVSKATLYSYFPDKRILFMEVAKSECARQTDQAVEEIDFSDPPSVVLRGAARRMVSFLVSDLGQRVFRICVAEGERFPELGQEFYAQGPGRGREILKDYFRIAIGKGELAIDDLDLAADQFLELCKSDLFPRMVFGISKTFSAAEIERVVGGAVDVFLARYGVQG